MTARVALVLAGLTFALGLVVSGMTRPDKVMAFLDVGGAWDPSLILVMASAVAVYLVADRLSRRLSRPLLAATFPEPPARVIDARLAAGAAIFGAGWGLSGFCPGPALVAFGAGAPAALWFVPAMVAGMALWEVLPLERRKAHGRLRDTTAVS
jgi:uncharacterized membrane protein YedE/YeeE